jgi:hypothetical protein
MGHSVRSRSCYNDAMGRRVEHPLDGADVRYTLRVPPHLYRDVVALADEDGWAVHTELLQAVREYVRRRHRRAAKEAS